MKLQQKIARVFGIVFFISLLLGLSREIVLAQRKVNHLGHVLSTGPVSALIENSVKVNALIAHMERLRVSLGFERIEIFDQKGYPLASAPATSHGTEGKEIHGVLTSARTEVHFSGRQSAHVVVWRNMDSEVTRPLLISFAAGLLAALLSWPIVVRKTVNE
jgi:hypothetical protein